MSFLDYDHLDAFDDEAFRATQPYPWANPEGLLTDEGYRLLYNSLPDVSLFTEFFGVKRSHGQYPHDRLTLDYHKDLDIPPAWHAFIAELRGPEYNRFIRRNLGHGSFRLNFHWHYTPDGCSVSPHCDAKRKLGSHIFYFNTESDWDSSWGGETLILDDHGRFKYKSAPQFENFDHIIRAEAMGNRSVLFARRERSWHGVEEIHCPQGRYRKVFIVVINDWLRSMFRRGLGILKGERAEAYY
ncbi:MAG: 2OG-Fe(II) oxygenase [Gammaproteobacteria bacterium]